MGFISFSVCLLLLQREDKSWCAAGIRRSGAKNPGQPVVAREHGPRPSAGHGGPFEA